MKLMCLATVIVNMTTTPLNKQDYAAISRAEYVCSTSRYDKGCVKQFQKREQGIYRVECGDKTLFDKKDVENYELSVIINELRHLSDEEFVKAMGKIGIDGTNIRR